jgi:electron transport complex protein RnfC
MIIKPKGRPRGGIKFPHRKYTAEFPTERYPLPDRVSLLMLQHIGAPCKPIVKVGDEVFLGQKIADSDSPVSTPIHASVSGKVAAISRVQLPAGNFCEAVEIESDGNQTPYPGLSVPKIGTKEEFIAAVKESGIVGLGGAGFPTHIKLNPRGEVDTLVINAAECEPYITADYRTMVEEPDKLLYTLNILKKLYGFSQTVIVIEDNKPKAVEVLEEAVRSSGRDDIFIMPVKSLYPRGAEKITVFLATGRVVPEGGLPADVGCIVINVTTAVEIARYLQTGMPLVERRVTVSGEDISAPKNLFIPLGTKVSEILDYCGATLSENQKVLYGGPMMGLTLQDDSLPTIKQNNALVVLSEKESAPKPISNCIRCGRCAAKCPMSLQPAKVERDLKLGSAELSADHVMTCMECGCCAAACPANRPLVQVMRMAKTTLKKEGKK